MMTRGMERKGEPSPVEWWGGTEAGMEPERSERRREG